MSSCQVAGSFFQKGATSVIARFDYWNAAVRTALAHPLFGTGPGTFAKPYQRLKKPESEMARLVHNDYLEQASDSGWPGFFSYTVFIAAALFYAYPRRIAAPAEDIRASPAPASTAKAVSHASGKDRVLATGDPGPQSAVWPAFALWLGTLGWALQGMLEFGLYIPALAWPAFAFLGWLLRHASTRA